MFSCVTLHRDREETAIARLGLRSAAVPEGRGGLVGDGGRVGGGAGSGGGAVWRGGGAVICTGQWIVPQYEAAGRDRNSKLHSR